MFHYLCCALSFQSFMAGLAASGVLTSALRLITKAAFESSKDGLRIGASKSVCETFAYLVNSYSLFEFFKKKFDAYKMHKTI